MTTAAAEVIFPSTDNPRTHQQPALMKPRHPLEAHGLATQSNPTKNFIARRWSIGALALAFVVFYTSSWGQAIRFRVPPYRVTVPLNFINTTVPDNQVKLSGVTKATFTISVVPAGAGTLSSGTQIAS